MNYLKIDKYDIANGIGIGAVLWVAGCSCRCHGCHNPQTWDFGAGQPFTDNTMQELLKSLDKSYVSRLTLSGGHPLEPRNALEILKIVKRVKTEFPNKYIWIYTGYVWEQIITTDLLPEILKYTDVLVDGPYVESMRDISLSFRGSSNQRVISVKRSLEEGEIVLLQEK